MSKKEAMKGNSQLSEKGSGIPQGRVDPKDLPQAILAESAALLTAAFKAPETIEKVKALTASVEPLEVLIHTSDQVGTDHLVEVTISSRSLHGKTLKDDSTKDFTSNSFSLKNQSKVIYSS